jgi:serine/threonine protein kinase
MDPDEGPMNTDPPPSSKTDSVKGVGQTSRLQRNETVPSAVPSEAATLPHPPGAGNQAAAATKGIPNQLPAPFGRYHLLKLLGQGGMGSVYLAIDSQLERQVALKVPHFGAQGDSAGMERFFREARAAATLHHPNICPVYDVGEINGTHYLTMAFLEGKPLSELISASSKPLPLRQVAALVRKLALALEEAHRHKVIHRDLKPANIMLTKRGEPVILDFGLARRGCGTDVRLTQPGAIMGTPAYMAPEQARGNPDDIGPSCDIYSLGMILYELLTRKLPFRGDALAILSQALIDDLPPPSRDRPDLDTKLEAICLKALAKKTEDRYRSMAELAAVLADYLKGTTTITAGHSAPSPSAVPLPFTEVLADDLPSTPRQIKKPKKQTVHAWSWPTRAAVVCLFGLPVTAGLVYLLLSRNPAKTGEERPSTGQTSAMNQELVELDNTAATEPGTKSSAGQPVEVMQSAAEDQAFVWPVEALKGSKIEAPLLLGTPPWLLAEFKNSLAGFPSGNNNRGEHALRGGKYVIRKTKPGFYAVLIPLEKNRPSNAGNGFACQVVGKSVGTGSGWGLAIREHVGAKTVVRARVLITVSGQLHTSFDSAEDGEAKMDAETVSHPALQKGGPIRDRLLVVVRGRQMEIYVNGIAVHDPILLERENAAPALALLCMGRQPGTTAEFDSVTVWPVDSIPPLEKRGAIPKGK